MKKLYLIIIILISVIICIPTITKASMIDDVISGADTFLNTEPEKDKNNLGGGTSKVDEEQLKEASTGIYNILFYIGMAITVLVGAVMGIQFMMDNAEGKAKVKEALIPYIIGCFVIFGSYGIWRICIKIFTSLD